MNALGSNYDLQKNGFLESDTNKNKLSERLIRESKSNKITKLNLSIKALRIGIRKYLIETQTVSKTSDCVMAFDEKPESFC